MQFFLRDLSATDCYTFHTAYKQAACQMHPCLERDAVASQKCCSRSWICAISRENRLFLCLMLGTSVKLRLAMKRENGGFAYEISDTRNLMAREKVNGNNQLKKWFLVPVNKLAEVEGMLWNICRCTDLRVTLKKKSSWLKHNLVAVITRRNVGYRFYTAMLLALVILNFCLSVDF